MLVGLAFKKTFASSLDGCAAPAHLRTSLRSPLKSIIHSFFFEQKNNITPPFWEVDGVSFLEVSLQQNKSRKPGREHEWQQNMSRRPSAKKRCKCSAAAGRRKKNAIAQPRRPAKKKNCICPAAAAVHLHFFVREAELDRPWVLPAW